MWLSGCDRLWSVHTHVLVWCVWGGVKEHFNNSVAFWTRMMIWVDILVFRYHPEVEKHHLGREKNLSVVQFFGCSPESGSFASLCLQHHMTGTLPNRFTHANQSVHPLNVPLTCAQTGLVGWTFFSHTLHKYGVHGLHFIFLIAWMTKDK